MNPLTNTRNISKLSERELKSGDGKTSWHDEYRGSAWIFIGGLPYDLTEGDVISVFSQYGEVVNMNLCRDKVTGKSKGFGFVCYEDQRSTVLAVDNFNGIKVLGRTIRVDHVKDYKPPKDSDKLDDITRQLMSQGCAPKLIESPPRPQKSEYELVQSPPRQVKVKEETQSSAKKSTESKEKKSKKSSKSKKKKSKESKKKKKRKYSSSSSSESDSDSSSDSDSRSKRKRK